MDTLHFEFSFESFKTSQKQISKLKRPPVGSQIYGVCLEGASWSLKNRCIDEASEGELDCQMPLITLLPRTPEYKRIESCYECPVYRTANRYGTLTTTGHSTNFVMYADLPCGEKDQKHWCKRAVAILCELAD